MIKCRWYVLHAYSGYEKKVADSIVDQAEKLGISEHIEETSVPTQNIVEVKRGVRVNSERKIFPGYILIKMNLNDDTWHIIKNTPKLSGFLGNKGKPIPISNALLIGIGLPLFPRKPDNLGVFLMICHVSSFKFILIKI